VIVDVTSRATGHRASSGNVELYHLVDGRIDVHHQDAGAVGELVAATHADGEQVTWTQTITRPLRLDLAFALPRAIPRSRWAAAREADDVSALAARMDSAAQHAADGLVGVLWASPPASPPESGRRAGQRGGPRGDRTHNPRIKSPLLCQLS
jgi:hypothetical protein